MALSTSASVRIVLVLVALVSSGCGAKKAETKAEGTGTIPVTASDKGFVPSSVKVKKGAPATLVFTRTTDDTCATEVVFPDLNVKKALPKGQAVAIDLPTDKEQTLTFQCGMGMYKSSVVVAAN